MNFNCGIVGLPNIGKSTLFNVLTQSTIAEVANYSFCTIEPNIGKVPIKDQRLKQIAAIANSEKIIYNQLEVIDIAGLVRGASKGKGLGNRFLSYIREVDAIIHLLRCFTDDNISHIYNKIDPISDAEIVEMELILADIDSIEKRLPKLERKAKKQGSKELKRQLDLMQEILVILKLGKPARSLRNIDKAEAKSLQLLTTKPIIYVCNIEDTSVITGNELSKKVEKIAEENKSKFYCISAKLEADIANLADEKEKQSLLSEFGLQESGLDGIARIIYNEMLSMITFFTVGPKEARAWPIKIGSTADKAAGTIHTDFEKGFVKAETISFTDHIKYGSESACKNAGKIRFEGRDYIVQDGDIMHFRFNV
ncbi:redox-regulated ATPase YchF [Wolbachia endosymbiont of Dirofilaria (Dirofilaria) immitis]|uniref:redox-regulated ATPase YchF n=1 Tax=Wolbachia endosymbiont of Dirofilaria (Dirofilaria) immitis TaxID=1812115 RepID=UPI00158A391C|nr:redox-regulated ATPase YchF [Wolbachia endosymbiont of Dirofilaria (Dirofilaria) immitis]QKX02203.1 redox-regulated ATPase YchF [Wolbachia endosymbiont of Dirofilaria (Dirofilaria) immitis]